MLLSRLRVARRDAVAFRIGAGSCTVTWRNYRGSRTYQQDHGPCYAVVEIDRGNLLGSMIKGCRTSRGCSNVRHRKCDINVAVLCFKVIKVMLTMIEKIAEPLNIVKFTQQLSNIVRYVTTIYIIVIYM